MGVTRVIAGPLGGCSGYRGLELGVFAQQQNLPRFKCNSFVVWIAEFGERQNLVEESKDSPQFSSGLSLIHRFPVGLQSPVKRSGRISHCPSHHTGLLITVELWPQNTCVEPPQQWISGGGADKLPCTGVQQGTHTCGMLSMRGQLWLLSWLT